MTGFHNYHPLELGQGKQYIIIDNFVTLSKLSILGPKSFKYCICILIKKNANTLSFKKFLTVEKYLFLGIIIIINRYYHNLTEIFSV
jgi:hypothetical protein